MKTRGDCIRLSSGREIFATRGVLGLSLTEDQCIAFDGYEGEAAEDTYPTNSSNPHSGNKFTLEERKEIALAMIELWKKWGGI